MIISPKTCMMYAIKHWNHIRKIATSFRCILSDTRGGIDLDGIFKAAQNAAKARTPIIPISHFVSNSTSCATTYKAGYTTIIVNSRFVGEETLENLLYSIALQKLDSKE